MGSQKFYSLSPDEQLETLARKALDSWGLARKSVDEAGSSDLESEPRRKRASTIYCTAWTDIIN